MHVKI